MRTYKMLWIILLLVVIPGAAFGGDLNPPAGPNDPASAMYTLEDIYQRLHAGAPAVKRSGPFRQPPSAPVAGTGHSLNDIMNTAPPAADELTGAKPQDVKAGKKFWGLSVSGWGLQTGTLHLGTGTLSDSTTIITYGYYEPTSLDAVDPDLKSSNIANGVTIFGITGDPNVVNTADAAAAAADILSGRRAWVQGQEVIGTALWPSNLKRTGQTISYAPGDDGAVQTGAVEPTPRFTDNGDGTISDNLTGMIWLKNANCFGAQMWDNALEDGVAAVNRLQSGQCGLSDGSQPGEWRVPNLQELQSVIGYSQHNPALPAGHPFANAQSGVYWTSTTSASGAGFAWGVDLYNGQSSTNAKDVKNYVWAVKGGL